MGIGSNVLAVIGAGDGRGGSYKRQRAQRGKETDAWGSHCWEGLSVVLTSSSETIENDSHILLRLMETRFTDLCLRNEIHYRLPLFVCRCGV